MNMNTGRLTAAAEHLRHATGLAAILDAACDAFEQILAVIGDHEDTGAVDIPLVLAATQAANGRDTLLFAPSLPPHRLHQPQQTGEPPRLGAANITAAVAELSMLLATELAHAARTVAAGPDQAACQDAASYARAIRGLLAGTGP